MVQCHSQFPTPARRLQEWIHELGLGLGYCDLDCIPHVGCTLEVKNARVGLDWMREVSYSSVLQFYRVYQGGYFFICQQIGVGFKRPWLKIGVPKGTANLEYQYRWSYLKSNHCEPKFQALRYPQDTTKSTLSNRTSPAVGITLPRSWISSLVTLSRLPWNVPNLWRLV